MALSLAHDPVLPAVHLEQGVSAAGLQPAADWFSEAFRQLTPEEASKKVHSSPFSLLSPACSRAGTASAFSTECALHAHAA